MIFYLDYFCKCDRNIAKVNQTGEISELAFSLAAVKQGYTVFTPHTHNTKIDIILHKPGQPPITCPDQEGNKAQRGKQADV